MTKSGPFALVDQPVQAATAEVAVVGGSILTPTESSAKLANNDETIGSDPSMDGKIEEVQQTINDIAAVEGSSESLANVASLKDNAPQAPVVRPRLLRMSSSRDSINSSCSIGRFHDSHNSNRTSNASRSKAAFHQSLYYVTLAFSTAICVWLPWIGLELKVESELRFFFSFMVALALPIQGFFNFIVYVRPQYLRLRRQKISGDAWRMLHK